MATITTIKQYDFCEDIFKKIISYTGYKKAMPTIGKRLLNADIQKIFNKFIYRQNTKTMSDYKADVNLIYSLRMVMSYEQLQYERTKCGKNALVNYQENLRQVELTQPQDTPISLYGWWYNDGLLMWNYITRTLWNRWFCNYGPKITHLKEIIEAGKNSASKHKKIQSKIDYNKKRREIVVCECGKSLSRGALSRHKNKCSI
jgi:hypothetical protein